MISSFPGSYRPYDPNNPFYNPNDPYGWNQPNPQTQEQYGNVGWEYGEQNHDASFTRRLAEMGLGGTDPRSVFAAGQLNKAERGYGASKQTNLDLQWQNYLKSLDFDRMYNNQSPNLKGYSDQTYAPPARWQMRA